MALDLSHRQLQHALRIGGGRPRSCEADAGALPFADASFDLACSAYGAVPFVADPVRVLREVRRVLRPGGRWVFSVTHPIRWAFPDEPGPEGLSVAASYFDRTPYVEQDEQGRAVYVEHHRTLGDRVRDVVAGGFRLVDLVEPEWPAWNTPGVGRLVPAARQPDPGHGDLRLRAGLSGLRGRRRADVRARERPYDTGGVIRTDALDRCPSAPPCPPSTTRWTATAPPSCARRPAPARRRWCRWPWPGCWAAAPVRRVVVAEPRRIAARAAARRMAWLLGEQAGEQRRLHRARGAGGRAATPCVEVVTTGVLLQRLQRDQELAGRRRGGPRRVP